MNDPKLLDLYLSRSESAIQETERHYGGYCYAIAMQILHREEDAGECVNDTWLAAWNSIPPQEPTCFASYLGRITRNLALDRYRQNIAQKRGFGQPELVCDELKDCLADPMSVEQMCDEKLLVTAINQFLHRQSKLKQNLFVRRYWYVSSIREIADDYGMSESKVTSLLFRMRKQLKDHLIKEGLIHESGNSATRHR